MISFSLNRIYLLGITVLGLAVWLPATASAQHRPSAPHRSYNHSNFRSNHHSARPYRHAAQRPVRHHYAAPRAYHRTPAVRFYRPPSAIYYPSYSHYTGPIYYRTPPVIVAPYRVYPYPRFFHCR